MTALRVGVLALQGDFAEHLATLRRLSRKPSSGTTNGSANGAHANGSNGHAPTEDLSGEAEAVEVRLPSELARVDALIIPGGESTTIGKLLVQYRLLEPLRAAIADGLPVFGTCAGAIVLARDIGGLDQPLIGAMDLTVRRNAFGRQLQSFEADLVMPALGAASLRAVFIRAPAILSVGPDVEVLARLDSDTIVAAQQGNLLATTFHPELTDDTRLHRYFVEMAREARR